MLQYSIISIMLIKLYVEDPEPFTEPELVEIGRRIPDKWEMMALSTGKFKMFQITDLKANLMFPNNNLKAVYMLNTYINQKGGSRKELVSILKRLELYVLAGNVESKRWHCKQK